jgi:hypothetical protein
METFHPDKPVSSSTEDHFQRYTFAGRIASIINGSKNPKSIVIGIYGKWGEGKTTVLNFIEQQLAEDTIFIQFNPWRFQDEPQLIRFFFTSVASALGKRLPSRKKEVFKLFSEYGDSISATVPVFLKPVISIAKHFARKVSEDTLEDQKRRIEEFIVRANASVVITIDDIDRLDTKEIQAVFKLVKLSGDFPRFSYILAFDNDLVAASLGQQFGSGTIREGYDFLEKIIQVPLQLPKAHTSALRAFSLDLLNKALDAHTVDLTESETREFVSMFDTAFVPGLKNPRLAIRTANAIAFALPLLYKEVHTGDLLIIECIKVFYPELHAHIRNDSDLFLTNYQSDHISSRKQSRVIRDQATKEIAELLKPYGEDLGDKIKDMLCDLFPQLGSLYNNVVYPDERWREWYRQKRICSIYYFNRYFAYVVKEGDISDIYFDELLQDVVRHNSDYTVRRLREELTKHDASDFLFKLRFQCEKFSPETANALLIPLAMVGDSLPEVKGFALTTPKRDAANIIKYLLLRLPATHRSESAHAAIVAAHPYHYAIEIYRHLMQEAESQKDEPFLTGNAQWKLANAMRDKFRQRIKQLHFTSLPDTELLPTFGIYNFLNEYAEIRALIMEELRSDSNVARIITMFSPTITSSSEPESYKSGMTEEGYDFLKKFIDPAVLFDISVRSYGDNSDTGITSEHGEKLDTAKMVAVFQKIHALRMEQEETNRTLSLSHKPGGASNL